MLSNPAVCGRLLPGFRPFHDKTGTLNRAWHVTFSERLYDLCVVQVCRIKNEPDTEVVVKKLKQGGLLGIALTLTGFCHYYSPEVMLFDLFCINRFSTSR
jgi:hypothetical protein